MTISQIRGYQTQTQIEASSKNTKKAYLADEETFALTLMLILADEYGEEMFNGEDGEPWTPETIQLQVEQDFGVRLPKENLDRLMVVTMLVTTDYFYNDVKRFIDFCNILSGDDFQPAIFEPADAHEITWGIIESFLIFTPQNMPQPFTAEIEEYIRLTFEEEGILQPPSIFGYKLPQGVMPPFEDDPEMFHAVYEMQKSRARDLTTMVATNVAELCEQLETLKLKNGDTTSLIKLLKSALGDRHAVDNLQR